MKIDITNEEFESLLVLLYVGTWIIRAHKTYEDPETQKYDDLEQKIFAIAHKMGYDDLFYYEEKEKTYYPTEFFEENSECHRFIDEYESEIFWEELIERLINRDFVNQEGIEAIQSMGLEERITKFSALEAIYNREFQQNGIENLKIVTSESEDSQSEK